MRHYRVTVRVQVPAPREFSFDEQAGSVEAAVARALRKFRKTLPRKQISQWRLDVVRA